MEVHASDLKLWNRCKRRWEWESINSRALRPIGAAAPALEFGTAFHAALQDYYGQRKYMKPSEYFLDNAPDTVDAQLGAGMLDYYTDYWLPNHNQYQTVWMRGEPLVECEFRIPLRAGIELVGTFDRIVKDEYGLYWIEDYKTTAAIQTDKLEFDIQAGIYTLAAENVLGFGFEGVIWTQFAKRVPSVPAILKNGSVSKSKTQATTYEIYRRTLKEVYGEIPQEYIPILNHFASLENAEGNQFIRSTKIFWSYERVNSLYREINAMVDDILRTENYYPNFTRDCVWDCPFKAPCIAKDEGIDYENMLETMYVDKRIEL